MTRNVLNFVIDAITAALALAMVLTGLLLRWVLPPGSGSQRTLWGFGRHEWGDMHWWIALALVGVALVHVAMHWRWVCAMVARMCGRGVMQSRMTSRVAGVAAAVLIGLLLWGFVAAARSHVQTAASAADGPASSVGVDLRGSTTLHEAAELLSVDVATVRARLGIDPGTDAEQKLGQVARDRGMRMSEVRRLVEDRDGGQ